MSTTEDRMSGNLVAASVLEAMYHEDGQTTNDLILYAEVDELRFATSMLAGLTLALLVKQYGQDGAAKRIELYRQNALDRGDSVD